MEIKTSEISGANAEIWKRSAQFPKYEASSKGRIRRAGYNGYRGHWHPPKEKAIKEDRYGYYRVNIGNWIGAHRVVADAFHGPSDMPQVNHINGDKKDNRPENLEWCTASQNAKHACDNGLWARPSGSKSKTFKGWIQAERGGFGFILDGNLGLINKGFGPSEVSKCLLGKRRTHKGFSFSRIPGNLGDTVSVPDELEG